MLVPSEPRTPSIGDELRTLRESRGLSIRALAELSDVSHATIASVEASLRYPSLRTLESLAAALDICVVVSPTETYLEPYPRR